MHVVVVSHHSPEPVGDGGAHRAYQAAHDLAAAIGSANVISIKVPPWWDRAPLATPPIVAPAPVPWMMPGVRRARRFTGALRRRLTQPPGSTASMAPALLPYTTTNYLSAGFLDRYENLVAKLGRPAVCVIEHTGFTGVISINQRLGLHTWCCPQNLEALDMGLDRTAATIDWSRLGSDLAHELRALEQCSQRLFISKVEAALIGGLGLSSEYYAYRPVGEIRSRLVTIRQAREATTVESGLFLMLGTAVHSSTGASLHWIVEQMQQNGLPAGTRVVVVGQGTNQLLQPGQAVPGLELRGWIGQNDLDMLLTRAQGVLVPQRVGFGALTRLSECACAGVPAIVSRHAAYAVDLPPGIRAVADTWPAWRAELQELPHALAASGPDEYATWENRQTSPWPALLGRVAAT